jgi:hypothetical protein
VAALLGRFASSPWGHYNLTLTTANQIALQRFAGSDRRRQAAPFGNPLVADSSPAPLQKLFVVIVGVEWWVLIG